MTNSDDPDKGVLRRQDGSIYNARDKDFLESINSSKAKQLRCDLLSGKQNSLCKTCWDKESIGLKSKRIVTNKIFDKNLNESKARSLTQNDGQLNEYKLGYLDLRFGNLCNLKCIMCHPSSSSKWYDDYVKLFNEKHFHDTGDKVALKEITPGKWHLEDKDYFKWYESESFWTALQSRIKDTKQIYLVGGEPLLIQEHLKFLQYCVQENVSSDITLEYDTNLTIINEEILSLWNKFKKVKLRISIESTGDQNNYIRYPSQWSDIEQNIKTLQTHGTNIEMDFSITWQIYNLFSVTKIWDQYGTLGSVRTLSQPEHLDIKILPKEYKIRAIDHLTPYLDSPPKIHDQIKSMLEYLKKHLDYQDDKSLNRFSEYTKSCDQIRKTQFREIFPELQSLID